MTADRITKPTGAGRDESRLVYRTELMRADVAARLAIGLGDVPGGGPVWWELAIDAVRVACTDELLDDPAAVAWARRMLGEGVEFLPGAESGYWVAGPTCEVTEWPAPAVRPVTPAVPMGPGRAGGGS